MDTYVVALTATVIISYVKVLPTVGATTDGGDDCCYSNYCLCSSWWCSHVFQLHQFTVIATTEAIMAVALD